MKKIIVLHLALLFFSYTSIAQNSNCNRAVWLKKFEKKLPKEVCIHNGSVRRQTNLDFS